MDIDKTFQISTDYKDRMAPPQWEMRYFAEILFVDKTNQGPWPLVFQLKENHLPLEHAIHCCRLHSTTFAREGFVLLGEGEHINRKSKQILLGNKNVVTYSHLVIISGSKPLTSFDNEELLSALLALSDALRVKPKIPSSFATSNASSYAHKPVVNDKAAIKIVHPNLSFSGPKDITFELNILGRRLYEVQL